MFYISKHLYGAAAKIGCNAPFNQLCQVYRGQKKMQIHRHLFCGLLFLWEVFTLRKLCTNKLKNQSKISGNKQLLSYQNKV